MEAAVEELTPLGVLKQPKVLGAWSEVWTYSRAGVGHSNLARARDIERRAIPECAMPAVPPPPWKLGFDQPCRSVNRARHIRRDRTKCALELAVEFRRATGSGLDSVQEFPQVHFSHPPWADGPIGSNCRIVRWVDYRERNPMTRIVLTALVLLDCVAFGTEVFAQAGQTINPVPITPPTLNTATTTCQTNCDTQAMTCQNSCVPTIASTITNPAAPTSAGACNLACTTQQLVCKQRC